MQTEPIKIAERGEAEVSEAFVAVTRIPSDIEGKPLYTTEEWINAWIRAQFLEQVHRGVRKLGGDAALAAFDNTIIDSISEQ